MSLSKVSIRNFQSLKKVDVELGKFTVIVGASNSGKSAFLRALRVLTHNASSPSFVTTGKKKSDIAGFFDNGKQAVSLERGKSLSTYHLNGEQYAKAGVGVPEDVSKFLALPEIEGDDLNFAFQFDRPFLLADASTKVAKVLGDLTNINVLFEAVRVVNRQRLDKAGKLKVRRSDIEDLKARIPEFEDIPAERKRLREARSSLEGVRDRAARLKRLEDLLETAAMAQAVLDSAAAKPLPQIDLRSVEVKVGKLNILTDALRAYSQATIDMKSAEDALADAWCDQQEKQEQYDSLIVSSGSCPLCGQPVDKEHLHEEPVPARG